MTIKQKLEDKILDDILTLREQHKDHAEFKQNVRDYFRNLLEEVQRKGAVPYHDGTIPCTPSMLGILIQRYSV